MLDVYVCLEDKKYKESLNTPPRGFAIIRYSSVIHSLFICYSFVIHEEIQSFIYHSQNSEMSKIKTWSNCIIVLNTYILVKNT